MRQKSYLSKPCLSKSYLWFTNLILAFIFLITTQTIDTLKTNYLYTMALNFDLMERIGEDVMYRRNSAKVINHLQRLHKVADEARTVAINAGLQAVEEQAEEEGWSTLEYARALVAEEQETLEALKWNEWMWYQSWMDWVVDDQYADLTEEWPVEEVPTYSTWTHNQESINLRN